MTEIRTSIDATAADGRTITFTVSTESDYEQPFTLIASPITETKGLGIHLHVQTARMLVQKLAAMAQWWRAAEIRACGGSGERPAINSMHKFLYKAVSFELVIGSDDMPGVEFAALGETFRFTWPEPVFEVARRLNAQVEDFIAGLKVTGESLSAYGPKGSAPHVASTPKGPIDFRRAQQLQMIRPTWNELGLGKIYGDD